MIGNNTIQLNRSEMMRALEYYLNQVQFKEPVKVFSIKENHSENYFAVSIQDADEKKAETSDA